jgi:hypothetical protein
LEANLRSNLNPSIEQKPANRFWEARTSAPDGPQNQIESNAAIEEAEVLSEGGETEK